MPSKNSKQHKIMNIAAHDPEFAKKVKIPQVVAEDFVAADKAAGKFQKKKKK